MEFVNLIQKRRSIRSFTNEPLDPASIEGILTAANSAPSAGNLQAYEIFLARRTDHLAALARAAYGQGFVADAPIALVFCAHPARSEERYRARGRRLYCIQDATIACTFAMLAATNLGLGSVWVGAFNDDAIREVIGVGAEMLPVAILSVGYPAEQPSARSRRALKDLVHRV